MNSLKSYVLWIFPFIILIISGTISQFKPSFIYDTINTKKLQNELQSIVNRSDSNENGQGLEYVISGNDSIIYWSSNKVDFSALQKITKTGVYNFSSRIYLVWTKQDNNKTTSYFIPLKNNFDIENNYLKNTSFNHLYFPINYTISKIPTDFIVPISIDTQRFNLYFEKTSKDLILSFWKSFLNFSYSISILIILILMYSILLKNNILSNLKKIILWLFILGNVYFFIVPSIPFSEEFYIFQPYSFANSYIPSLANLLIITILFFVFLVLTLRLWENRKPSFNIKQSIISQFIASVFLILITIFIYNILSNSTSYFTDFQGKMLRVQDVIILLVIGLWALVYVKILTFIIQHSITNRRQLLYSSFIYVIEFNWA